MSINTQTFPSSSCPPPSRPAPSQHTKASMLRQTYFLAHIARGKLSHEAAQADHNLRILVGHANLLDNLMDELAEAESEQESWFNASLKSASQPQQHIQWAPVASREADYENDEDDDQLYSSDSDSDEEEDVKPYHSRPSAFTEVDDDVEEDDMEDDYASLSLARTQSRSSTSPSSPPELTHDLEGDSSEDEAMPSSPPAVVMRTFTEKQRQQIVTTSFYDSSPQLLKLSTEDQASFEDDGYYLPPRRTGEMPQAICVY